MPQMARASASAPSPRSRSNPLVANPLVTDGNVHVGPRKDTFAMQAKVHTEADRLLRDSVMQQLEWDPEISSQDISVSAKDGAITLTGFVHNYLERIAAERIAKSVYGVKAIANDIETKPMTRTDPEIARDVMA